MQMTPPSDAASLRVLIRAREVRGDGAKRVSAVAKSARPAAISEQREHDARQTGERRHAQRRKRSTGEPLFNTRSNRERRATMRRKTAPPRSTEEQKETPAQGINAIA